jgi:hypothetical protein
MKPLLIIQALYFFMTGIWPMLHIRSFIKVTGPKHDIWLVKTVGVLIVGIALSLFTAAFSTITTASIVLATAAALALLIIDIYYTYAGKISSIYLLDAAAELILLSVWAMVLL